MNDVMAKPKINKDGTNRGGKSELACRKDYRTELMVERLTNRAVDHYVSPEMDWGTQNEPIARQAYELHTGVMVEQVGLVLHPTMDFTGASPDGLCDADGAIEIKCPKTTTFLEWRETNVVPQEHIFQMMWVMACCEREYCDFLAFDPRLPQGLRFFVKRLMRDDKIIAEMEREVRIFNEEIEAACARLGFPNMTPKAPKLIEPGKTERIGGLDVPQDIADMLSGEFIP